MTIDENRKIKYLKEILNSFDDDFDSLIKKLNYISEVKKIYEEALKDVNTGYELCAMTMLITYDTNLKEMVVADIKERINSLEKLYKITTKNLFEFSNEKGGE